MKKTLQIFGIMILALAFAVSPALAEETITPTEVERIKDYYYFKIHGGPWTPEVDYGKAEFIYKNLSMKPQSVNVRIEGTWVGKPYSAEFPRTLEEGEEWSSDAAEDFGVTVYFELHIDGSTALSGVIWVPPPP